MATIQLKNSNSNKGDLLRVLVTGAAGFIGFHTAKALLEKNCEVLGYDVVNDYYDPAHKNLRLAVLAEYKNFKFVKAALEDLNSLQAAYKKFDPSHVIHLAAQAGVRYSIENPSVYIQSNIVGFQNIIELVRMSKPQNFVYASSSSVYGGNKQFPFSESHPVENPVSLYAATKISNELVAKTYMHLYGIPSTGLRFFTVYGPYGRPDMAYFSFAKKIVGKEKISIFNHGNMARDFTYIDDILAGIMASLAKPESGQVYNLGRGKQESLTEMIHLLESNLGIEAVKEFLPMQKGDVERTFADISKAQQNLNYRPQTSLNEGIRHFVDWFKAAKV